MLTFKQHGVHVLGSFIFGLPTDKPATFDATVEMALKADITFAQFVMMTPFPGTVDFARWEKEQAKNPTLVGDVPITRYWLIPTEIRPKMFTPHPSMSSQEIAERTQKVWDRFYNWSAIWQRSACAPTLRARIAFVFLSKLYRQMYAGTGISTDSARRKKSKQVGPVDGQAVQEAVPGKAHAGTCSRQSGNLRLPLPGYIVPRFCRTSARMRRGPSWSFRTAEAIPYPVLGGARLSGVRTKAAKRARL